MEQTPCDFSEKKFHVIKLPSVYILGGIMFKLCNSISDFKNKFSLVQDSI